MRIPRGGALDPLRARDAVRGFRLLAPGLSRVPLPFAALCALVGAAAFLGLKKMALALAVQFCSYLRTGELLRLTRPESDPPGQGQRVPSLGAASPYAGQRRVEQDLVVR